MAKGVFCFRNDLRLNDHPALCRASLETKELFLIYVFEDRIWRSSRFSRINAHRARFILESLAELKSNVEKSGGILHFARGNISEVLPRFMEEMDASDCFLQAESAWEEKRVEEKLSLAVPVTLIEGPMLLDDGELTGTFGAIAPTFSQFRREVEKNLSVRPLQAAASSSFSPLTNPRYAQFPSIEQLGIGKVPLDPRQSFAFIGGESHAKGRLLDWVWSKEALRTYKETRNGLIGPDFSSRLSAWLSNGCISAQAVFHEIRRYEAKKGANESTYWLFFELLWRDYFHFLARSQGSKLFRFHGLSKQRSSPSEPKNAEELHESWKRGETGDAFVNANMNELRKTGWMSNRGRQNVASFLIHELRLDWRRGARWFEEQLIDYDPCSNYGNWLYLSGFGTDPRPNRVFNMEKQARTYDPNMEYRTLWNPSSPC